MKWPDSKQALAGGFGEGIVTGALFVAQDAGDEADDGVDEDHGGDFAAAEDVIADRDFVGF